MLLGLRDYQEDKVDIIHKYNADEARNLKAFGELPETAKINETAIDLTMDGGSDSEDELGVDFDDVRSGDDLFVCVCGWTDWVDHDVAAKPNSRRLNAKSSSPPSTNQNRSKRPPLESTEPAWKGGRGRTRI